MGQNEKIKNKSTCLVGELCYFSSSSFYFFLFVKLRLNESTVHVHVWMLYFIFLFLSCSRPISNVNFFETFYPSEKKMKFTRKLLWYIYINFQGSIQYVQRIYCYLIFKLTRTGEYWVLPTISIMLFFSSFLFVSGESYGFQVIDHCFIRKIIR